MAVGMEEPQACGFVHAAQLLGHHMVYVERLAIFESLVTAGAQRLLAPGAPPVAICRHSASRAVVHLGHSTNALEDVRSAPQHQPLRQP
jgi:hypothetical protein